MMPHFQESGKPSRSCLAGISVPTAEHHGAVVGEIFEDLYGTGLVEKKRIAQ